MEENTFFDHLDTSRQYAFTMCNPPFYSEASEPTISQPSKRASKRRSEPHSINTCQPHESTFSGGEVEFVKKMIDQSEALSERVCIFTTMLGKKVSLDVLRNYLVKEKMCQNVSETEFCQGRTMRWGLAWSFRANDQPQLPQFKYVK